MAKDPYSVLGVNRGASADDIRKAYRKLAKQFHPDRNQGDAKAEERFKDISAAFDILGDAEKRAKFDAGEIDADGNERATMGRGPFGQGGAGPWRARTGSRGEPGLDDISDIFGDIFGQSGARRGRPTPQKGRDIRYRLAVDFLDAARGTTKRVKLSDGRGIDVAIPEGLRDGQTLRLKGRGNPGHAGGPPGDVLVEISVKPHPVFTLAGDDLSIDIPITLKEAVLGAKVDVPTIKGKVTIKIPPNTSSGVAFRLREKGLKNTKTGAYGDLFARTRIVLPKTANADLAAFAESWVEDDYNPRDSLEAAISQ